MQPACTSAVADVNREEEWRSLLTGEHDVGRRERRTVEVRGRESAIEVYPSRSARWWPFPLNRDRRKASHVDTRLQGCGAPLAAFGSMSDGDSSFVQMGAHQPNMRVLAASFPDDALARKARAILLTRLALEAHQVGVETLAVPDGAATARAVLAGQFDEHVVNTAREVMEQLGGTVMLDIDATESNA